ncbi:MAG: sugar ABC transporter substrate-binding protein [Lachnospiraceae bacterium]|nr:sugar ABC transporter substrate-binding protein [Lachnospiraceae bacterium]
MKGNWKWMAAGLAAVMAGVLLAGTAMAENTDVSGEVRYAYWDDNQTPYIQQCIEEFNKEYPNVKVTLEPNTWDEYWTKLEAAATGGSIADVFWMNGPNITKYANGGILMPIDDMIEELGIDVANYPAGLVALYNIGGAQYALPKDFDTIGIWYNKALFDEAGVEYPTDDWTWEDMADKAAALTKDDGSVFGIGAGFDTQCGIYNTIFACGGYVISEDKKSSGYDLEETQAGVQCWIDLQEAGVSPSEASLEETTADAQFLSGRLAMYMGGSWFLGAVKTSDLMENIDVVELPSIGGKKATVIHGLGNCIYVDTKYPDAAKAWVSFLAGETANLISAETGAAIPALAGTAQAWVDATPEINLQSFITSSEEYSYPYPASANTAEWQTYEADCLKRAFSLDVPVADACAELAEKMNAVLAAE